MATNDFTREPKLRTRGPIRVTMPAAVAYDPDALKKSLAGVLDKIGCRACCSGADILLQMERDFIADEQISIRASSAAAGPPTPEPAHQYTVGLSPSVKYDIDRVFTAIDKVIDILGPHPCVSGFDVLLRDEIRTIIVDEAFEARNLAQGF